MVGNAPAIEIFGSPPELPLLLTTSHSKRIFQMIKSSKLILGLSFAALLATSGTASAEAKPVGIGSGDQMAHLHYL